MHCSGCIVYLYIQYYLSLSLSLSPLYFLSDIIYGMFVYLFATPAFTLRVSLSLSQPGRSLSVRVSLLKERERILKEVTLRLR
jgi:hypothetical protein